MSRRAARLLAVLGLGAVLAVVGPCFAQSGVDRVFGPITVQGNSRTSTGLILRELGIREGDPYDSGVVQRAWDHLEDLGYFAYVDLIEAEPDAAGRVALAITVEEEKTLRYYPLIDYDRRFKYRLGVMVEEKNLGGRGERLSLEASWLRVHGYRATWTRPSFAGRDWLEFGATAGWEHADFVYRPTKYSRWDSQLRLRAWLRGRAYVEASGELSGFRQVADLREVVPGSPPTVWDEPHGERNRFTPSLTLGLDNRDLEYYPTRGAWLRLTARREITDGFDSYGALTADLRRYVPMKHQKVLALRAYGRIISGSRAPIPIEDRLWWGGPETIRGYRFASLEGEEGWLLSSELRWPLFLMPISPNGHVIGIGVHGFWDAGDAWYETGHAHAPLMSWGLGAHLNLSSLNLRFEVARTREGQNVFQFEDHFNF